MQIEIGRHDTEVRNCPAVQTGQRGKSQFGAEMTTHNRDLVANAMAGMSDAELFDDGSINKLRVAAHLATMGDALNAIGAERRTRFLAAVKPHAW